MKKTMIFALDKLLADAKAGHEARIAEAKRIEDERIAKEKADAEAKAEREKAEALQAEIDRQLKDQREAAEAEAKRKEEAELAPDKAKLEAFAFQLRNLPLPSITSEIGKKEIATKLEELALWVEASSAKLKARK